MLPTEHEARGLVSHFGSEVPSPKPKPPAARTSEPTRSVPGTYRTVCTVMSQGSGRVRYSTSRLGFPNVQLSMKGPSPAFTRAAGL
jgi:hypothetical protein